jgi:hypothetical protein
MPGASDEQVAPIRLVRTAISIGRESIG